MNAFGEVWRAYAHGQLDYQRSGRYEDVGLVPWATRKLARCFADSACELGQPLNRAYWLGVARAAGSRV